MKSSYTWKAGLGIAMVAIGVLRAAPTETRGESENVKLFAHETSINVQGRTGKVVALTQSNGEEGYSPEKAKGFRVEAANQLPVPTSIHWHGFILPDLMDGVPFVSHAPIHPASARRCDFSL